MTRRCFGVSPISHARTDASSLDDGFGRLPRLERGPDLQPIVGLEPFEHESQVGGMESAQPALQLRGILALLQLHGDSTLRSILAVGERLERAVMLEQVGDVVERLMKVGCGSSLLHVTPNLHK